jgi:hypothetical protein
MTRLVELLWVIAANNRRNKMTNEKAIQFEIKAARWLHEANIASESGKKEQAEKLYMKSQYWHDKMNQALGNS